MSDARRLLRQHAETVGLMGGGFVYVRGGGHGEAEGDVAVEGSNGSAESGVDKGGALEELRARHATESPILGMISGWQKIVFGVGDPDASLMFVGEAPGADEDAKGEPFVGRAGQLLDKMIGAMGFGRGDVYIANVLKVRPPENRTPTPEEWAADGPYLKEQIRIVSPRVIVTLGRPAACYLLETDETMGRMRGRWAEFEGIAVMPTYHPAYLLRSYTAENRAKVWSDLQMAMGRLGSRQ